MKIETCVKPSFSVIGKEGSTRDGEGFIQRLWNEANSNFAQIADLAERDEDGNLVGIWGAMSDFSRAFKPWEDFKNGLYLAGVQCRAGAQPPEGWVKWTVPGYEFLYAESDSRVYSVVLRYMKENGLALAGAAHDFTCPKTGKNYVFFPIRKL